MTHAAHSRAPRRTWASHVPAVLAHRRLGWLAAALAVLLSLPALRTGLFADDYFHKAVLTGSRTLVEFAPSPVDMFAFFDADPGRTHRLMDAGFVPWWVYPGMKAAFWRPLTVLTHWLDYRLWPHHPWLMHAQNIAWYGALVAAVAWLYRRFVATPWIAGLAALLYAIDDAHAMPVAFLANRNALISAFFGILALAAHDNWRRGARNEPGAQATGAGAPRWRLGLVGPGLLLLSLLAKEEGIATCAYLAGYALFLERGPLARRAFTLAPYVVVVIAWRVVWSYLGYGVAEVGFYVDPLHEPGRYLQAVVQRAPYLFLGQWAAPPAELYIMENFVGTTLVRALWWAGIALVVLLGFALWPLLRRDATARFWAAGTLLALLPACATFPADRMLLFSGVGAMALVAQLVGTAWGTGAAQAAGRAWRVPARALGIVFILLHLIVAPLALLLRVGYPAGPKSLQQFAMRAPLDATVEQQDVVLLNPPSLLHTAYFPWEREAAGLPIPRRVRYLGSGMAAMTVHRADARTLVIRIDGGYIGWSIERLFRDERHPMAVGERVVLTGMTAEVTALTADGRPAEAAFRFDVPLEDAALRWLWWHDGQFRPFTLPAVGETIELPRARPGSVM